MSTATSLHKRLKIIEEFDAINNGINIVAVISLLCSLYLTAFHVYDCSHILRLLSLTAFHIFMIAGTFSGCFP